MALPGGPVVKNLAAGAGATVSWVWSLGSGRPAEGGNGNPLQYSCLKNSMEKGDWRAAVHRVTKESDRIWRLNNSNNNLFQNPKIVLVRIS